MPKCLLLLIPFILFGCNPKTAAKVEADPTVYYCSTPMGPIQITNTESAKVSLDEETGIVTSKTAEGTIKVSFLNCVSVLKGN